MTEPSAMQAVQEGDELVMSQRRPVQQLELLVHESRLAPQVPVVPEEPVPEPLATQNPWEHEPEQQSGSVEHCEDAARQPPLLPLEPVVDGKLQVRWLQE